MIIRGAAAFVQVPQLSGALRNEFDALGPLITFEPYAVDVCYGVSPPFYALLGARSRNNFRLFEYPSFIQPAFKKQNPGLALRTLD